MFCYELLRKTSIFFFGLFLCTFFLKFLQLCERLGVRCAEYLSVNLTAENPFGAGSSEGWRGFALKSHTVFITSAAANDSVGLWVLLTWNR